MNLLTIAWGKIRLFLSHMKEQAVSGQYWIEHENTIVSAFDVNRKALKSNIFDEVFSELC